MNQQLAFPYHKVEVEARQKQRNNASQISNKLVIGQLLK